MSRLPCMRVHCFEWARISQVCVCVCRVIGVGGLDTGAGTFEFPPQTLILLGRHSHIARRRLVPNLGCSAMHVTVLVFLMSPILVHFFFTHHASNGCRPFRRHELWKFVRPVTFSPTRQSLFAPEISPHCAQVHSNGNSIPMTTTLDIRSAKGWNGHTPRKEMGWWVILLSAGGATDNMGGWGSEERTDDMGGFTVPRRHGRYAPPTGASLAVSTMEKRWACIFVSRCVILTPSDNVLRSPYITLVY